jgi:hypothetical protein
MLPENLEESTWKTARNKVENNIKINIKDVEWSVWIEVIWLWTGRSGGLL